MNNYKIGIYIRLSKEDEYKREESESITNQRNIILDYINKNNYLVYDEYVDDGYSGTNFERPAFKKLLLDIENGLINMVITKDMSRLGRDYIQSGYYIEEYFPTNKVRYVSVTENIDTAIDSSNNDIAPFKALFNDMYSKDLSRKIKSVLKNKKEMGLFLGSNAPFGYQKSPENKYQLIIDKNTSKIVKKIFKLAKKGHSNTEIAIALNINHIITPIIYAKRKINSRIKYPDVWTASMIRNILKNKVYTGTMVQNKQIKVNYKSKKRKVVEPFNWIEKDNTHVPIIKISDFKIINNSSSFNKNLHVKPELDGLVFCHDCGCKLGMKYYKRGKQYALNCNQYTRNSKLKFCTSHWIKYNKLKEYVDSELTLKGINPSEYWKYISKIEVDKARNVFIRYRK